MVYSFVITIKTNVNSRCIMCFALANDKSLQHRGKNIRLCMYRQKSLVCKMLHIYNSLLGYF